MIEVRTKPRSFSHQLLSVDEVAEILGVDPRRIRSEISGKRLRAVRIGRLYKIHPDDLESYLCELANTEIHK